MARVRGRDLAGCLVVPVRVGHDSGAITDTRGGRGCARGRRVILPAATIGSSESSPTSCAAATEDVARQTGGYKSTPTSTCSLRYTTFGTPRARRLHRSKHMDDRPQKTGLSSITRALGCQGQRRALLHGPDTTVSWSAAGRSCQMAEGSMRVGSGGRRCRGRFLRQVRVRR
jgi:hypothetical protein